MRIVIAVTLLLTVVGARHGGETEASAQLRLRPPPPPAEQTPPRQAIARST